MKPASAGLALLSLLACACLQDAGLDRLVVAPDVRILSPQPSETVQRDDGKILAQGFVDDEWDPVDALDVWFVVDGEAAITVTPDEDGVVQTQLDPERLLDGPHTLTLTAVDTDEATAADTVRFNLFGGDGPVVLPEPATVGDLVITELFADPTAVADEQGEFVEILNVSAHPISLDGFELSDDGVDSYELRTSLVVPAGVYVVLCANVDAGTNGGVPCDAAWSWDWRGGGFALSNGGDEVVLRAPDGVVIDRVTYAGGQVTPGASLGVRPAAADAIGNDAPAAWCTQTTVTLSSGAAATPGQANDGC